MGIQQLSSPSAIAEHPERSPLVFAGGVEGMRSGHRAMAASFDCTPDKTLRSLWMLALLGQL
jgi:hypothetical protein